MFLLFEKTSSNPIRAKKHAISLSKLKIKPNLLYSPMKFNHEPI
jgi:hypothetical protein